MSGKGKLVCTATLAATLGWSCAAWGWGPVAPSHQAPPLSEAQRAASPYAGQANYAVASPQFRWGWFGADHFSPQIQWHRDYNGDVVRWSRRPRY